MKLPFGFELIRKQQGALYPPTAGTSNWFNVIRESFSGAWQRNVEIRLDNVLTYAAVYACVTLIAQDIGKLCLDLYEKDGDDIWTPTENPAFSPVLRQPNRYQTRQQFIENWSRSKLTHGNTYILKERDRRGMVVQMHVLSPDVTRVLIAPDGDVFYQLATNFLAGVPQAPSGVDLTEVTQGAVYVPASEIIHDVYCPLYHPLCGVSPISACGLAAVQGLAIQNNSLKFFNNGSQPGGVLIAPGTVSEANAKALKEYWEQNFTGDNAGKVAVLSDGLKYEPLTVSASDAQVINQLKWTDETVARAFKVPPYMIGVGQAPSYANVEAINLQYYTQCLQPQMEAIEALLDKGLGLLGAAQELSVAFDLDDLLKMDTATQYKTYGEGVARGILAINEARAKLGYGPVDGGGNYLQQQNYSLEALNKRDSKADPFAPNKSSTPALPPPAPANNNQSEPADAEAERSLHSFEYLAALRSVKHARTS